MGAGYNRIGLGALLAGALLAGALLAVAPAVAGPPAAAAVAGPPAAARHGAPDNPLSRTLACAPGGAYVAAPVCQAALAASGRAAFEDWDYLRIPDVQGRDREVVPDGALCSGGIDRFAGLDLARDDWPVTELPADAAITFTYRTTIPHQGTFRLYLTRDGYDPTVPLTWSALEEEPFLTVTDPEQVGDAYQLPGRTPSGASGRHVVFTIWQNSDTPDTYYSCSDVLFAPPVSPATGAGAAAGSDPPSPPATPAPPAPRPPSPAAGGTAPGTPAGAVALVIAGTAAVVLALALAVVALLQHRRHRARTAAGNRPGAAGNRFKGGGSHRHRPGS